MVFSPDGAHIVSGSVNKTADLGCDNGRRGTKMEGHSDLVQSVAFSLDGTHVLSGSGDNTVRILQRLTIPFEHEWESDVDAFRPGQVRLPLCALCLLK